MNKDQRSKKIKKMTIENSNESRSMPLAVGDIITFDGNADNFIEEVPANTETGFSAWTRINGTNGSISATQLLRSGNGLSISGNDNTERIQDLVDNNSDGDLVFSVLVVDEKIRNTNTGERRYFKLKVVAGTATKAEDFA